MSQQITTITSNGAKASINIEGGSFAGGSGSAGSSVKVQLLGTWSATLQFEASVDGGTTFIAVLGYPISSGVLGAGVTSTTANGVWEFLLGGFTHFQVRCSAFTSGTVNVATQANPGPGYAQGIAAAQAASGTAAFTTAGYSAALTITRPANTTQYTAGDTIGGALTFPSMGPSGGRIMITSAQLEYDVAAVPGTPAMTTCTLALYNVTPPSATADNAAWDIPAGDRASFLGLINLGQVVDKGSTLYVETTGINKQLKLAGTSLFAYLLTDSGFTPAGASEVLVVTLHAVAV